MPASTLGSQYRDGAIRVVREEDEIVAICLEGEFDLRNASALREEIDRALERSTDLILDLSRVTFIDSSVVRVLFQASKAVGENGQTAVLQLGTALIVERVLRLAGIERVLPRAHNRAEAIRIIQRQQGGDSSSEDRTTAYRADANGSQRRPAS